MITIYGISNCDTVKKSRAWLASTGVEYEFYDFKNAACPMTGCWHGPKLSVGIS